MKALTLLNRWCHAHPYLCMFFTLFFSCLITAMSFREDWFVPGLIYCVIFLITMAIRIWWDCRSTVLLLCLSLLLPNRSHAQERGGSGGAAGCAAAAVAVVVVVVGGIIIYKLIKTCQKKFPKQSTNAPPESVWGSGGSGDYSAALNFAELGSCGVGDACDQDGEDATTVTISLTLDSGEYSDVVAGPRIIASGIEATRSQTQDWNGFAREVNQFGVTITGHAGQFSYARDGQPIPAAESPILWNPTTQSARVNINSGNTYRIVVERSADLLRWTELLRTETQAGARLQIIDAHPGRQQFYRYSAVLAD